MNASLRLIVENKAPDDPPSGCLPKLSIRRENYSSTLKFPLNPGGFEPETIVPQIVGSMS